MEILASLREKGASRVRVRRCPKWTTSTTPVGLPAHAAFAGRIEKCRADCRQNHQEAFPGDGDVALLCYPTSISPSSTRDPESAEAGRGTRFLCVSRSRSRDRSHYCCGRGGVVDGARGRRALAQRMQERLLAADALWTVVRCEGQSFIRSSRRTSRARVPRACTDGSDRQARTG
jgi:hypothetical protein